jgi:lysosomal acid lipase/cholesteryl ester hydrolase
MNSEESIKANYSYPVLMVHGFLNSPDDLVSNGNKSIPFILARNGYDVWMGSSRGSKYSKEHITLDIIKDS